MFRARRLLLNSKPTKEEMEMRREMNLLLVEAQKVNLPSTFMEWAKLKRKAGAIEKALLKKEEERNQAQKSPWRVRVKKALGLRHAVFFVVLFFFYEGTLPKAPLLEVSSAWMWPYGRILALPNYYAGALSVVGWSVVCQKFCGRLCSAFF
mmetsp:Transcript_14181/g.25178  ORF Transcript_14181/g.25178 Transcript_14181/m.25178 type:complete len:151 (-) Transcript_14181:307-759(-)